MKVKFFLPLILLSNSVLAPASAEDLELSAPIAQKLLRDEVRKAKKGDFEKLQVRSVLGCYPAAHRPSSERLCLLEMNKPNGEFSIQTLSFQRKGEEWSFINPDSQELTPSPACPSSEMALPLLVDSFHDPKLEVTDGEEEGTFTDERGMTREKKGPYRLMCAYGVKRSIGEQSVVAYFQYRDGKYLLDSDKEVWNDF